MFYPTLYAFIPYARCASSQSGRLLSLDVLLAGMRQVPWVKIIHYGVFGVLMIAASAYFILKPPFVNPMADPGAADAMALVQTHRAQQAPTIRQAIDERVKALADQGRGVRLGEWRVEREAPGIYVVRITVREQITMEWFERNYLWRVDVQNRRVEPLTLPATTVMPRDGDGENEST